jgi:hypothetical protein
MANDVVEVDASYVAIARHYFANAARTTKKQEEGEFSLRYVRLS